MFCQNAVGNTCIICDFTDIFSNFRTQTDGKVRNRASGKITKRKATKSGVKHTTGHVEVDFDRLVSNIENSIMADQDRGTVGITPQELLVKSNPAMYSFERELTRDLTNPREMYSLLSHNTKSTEDLTAKFKQEIARNIQAPGVFPKLSRATTLYEIRRLHHGKSDKLGRFQSASEVLTPNKKLNVLVVTRNKTNLESFRTIIEEDKENLHALNLPNITQIFSNKGDTGLANDKNKRLHVEFPMLSADQNVRNRISTAVKDTDNGKESDGVVKQLNTTTVKSADPKIDKWFSEMPNEVFDKAQRAIMESSIKDKLTKYQHKRNRKENFPAHVNILHGSRLRKVPNTFLEVRVDSFGQYLKNQERMNKYKLQQKSILKLKMRDVDEMERQDKGREDMEFSQRLRLQYRSHTTMTYKNKNDPSTEKPNRDAVVNKDDKGLKTYNVNEVLKRDIMSRERTHINNYRDYTEKRHLSKSAHDAVRLHDNNESERDTVPKNCSPISKESETGCVTNKNTSGSERGVAKTSVVTIALGKDNGAKSKKQSHKQVLNATGENDKDCAENKKGKETVDTDKSNTDGRNEKDKENEEEMEAMDESSKCVTKIPTAKSSRTSDSNRSTISSKQSPKPNKSVLSRFNKLEVFAEHGKASDAKMIRNSYHGHKLRDHESKEPTMPPSYKLDLKNYPQHFKNPIPDEDYIINTEVRKQDLVFRFEPGEVFITRKSNPNRASERARVIYGKVLNKDDKVSASKGRDHKQAKESHSAHSLSTGLDGYKFEVGNFEHRALADSVPSDAVREHGHPNTRISNPLDEESEYVNRPDLETTSTVTKTPQEFYIRYGKVMRDIAIETDILGSETDSLQGHFVEDGSKFVHRPESSLSDYIIDNNDGESLNSYSDADEHMQANHVRKSTVKSRGTQSRVST